MPRIDEELIFPLLLGLAVLLLVAGQMFPRESRLRRFCVGAFALLFVGGIVLSFLLYLADLTAR